MAQVYASAGVRVIPGGIGRQPPMFTIYSSLTNTLPTDVIDWSAATEILLSHPVRAKKDGTLLSPALLSPGATRKNHNVNVVTAFVVDLDGVPFTDVLRERLAEVEFIAHTTWSHTDASPHWRVIIPFDTPIAAADWPTVWRKLRNWIDVELDESCKESSRCYFIPNHREGFPYQTVNNMGKPRLNPLALPAVLQSTAESLVRALQPHGNDILADPLNEIYKRFMANKTDGRHAALCSATQSLANIAALNPTRKEKCDEIRDKIGREFTAAVTADNTRTPAEANKELDDAISSAHRNAPTPRVRHDDTPPPPQHAKNLPTEFWESRPTLKQIRDAAHSAYVSADVVLGCVLARIAARTHWSIRIPNIGTRAPGSLNIFIAPVGESGTSKSSAYQIADVLIRATATERILLGAPLGSGEGIIEAFLTANTTTDPETRRKTTTKTQTRDGVLFHLDEGAAFEQLGDRKGTTLKPTLRQAWNGETLGQTNASQETRRCLPAHHYRMCLVMSFQPAYTEHLLSESDAGTPQRFIWLSATDPNIPDKNKTNKITPLDWKPPQTYGIRDGYTTQILKIDASIITELEARSLAKARGGLITVAMDSHRDLQHMKTAALLAILDNRLNITRDDWDLANMLLETSRAVWESCQAHITAKHRAKNNAADTRAINRMLKTEDASENNALDKMARAVDNMARAITHKVHKENTGLTKRDLRHATSSADRGHASLEDAIDLAIEKGWIMKVDDTYMPGESTPT